MLDAKFIRPFINKTPVLFVDLRQVADNMRRLQNLFGNDDIYYAVKAAPFDEVLCKLNHLGAFFDVASTFEMDQLRRMSIPTQRMSFSNTIKKPEDIAYCAAHGLNLFASDAPSDLEKIAAIAPGAKIFFRLNTEGAGADWPLSKKFGASAAQVRDMLRRGKELDVVPYGLSFHVGSQQRNIEQWNVSIGLCRELFDFAESIGIKLQALNLGGGLPTPYLVPTPSIEEYGEKINGYLAHHFPTQRPHILLEPGRYMAGDAGVILTRVVMIAKRNSHTWVYLDIGKFGGLIETIRESIKYPITVIGKENPAATKPVVLAGPTCDGLDVLYENYLYELPANLEEGDHVLIHSTGAYTQSYCAVSFNGFPPLKTVFING